MKQNVGRCMKWFCWMMDVGTCCGCPGRILASLLDRTLMRGETLAEWCGVSAKVKRVALSGVRKKMVSIGDHKWGPRGLDK